MLDCQMLRTFKNYDVSFSTRFSFTSKLFFYFDFTSNLTIELIIVIRELFSDQTFYNRQNLKKYTNAYPHTNSRIYADVSGAPT
jgi:hypothetical protein